MDARRRVLSISVLVAILVVPPGVARGGDRIERDRTVRAEVSRGGDPIERDQIVRPGMAMVPERAVAGTGVATRMGLLRGTCTVAFLFAHRGSTYAATQGHCYANTGDHPTRKGFLDHGDTIVPELDDAYSAVACGQVRLCGSKKIGKFVYAINNPYPDPVDGSGLNGSGLNGTNNPALSEVGDFGLIRLHPGVPYDPAMCLYGGPEYLFEEQDLEPEIIRIYQQGFIVGSNQLAGGVLPGSTGVAVPGDTESRYDDGHLTFTSVQLPDPGGSGGPIMTSDGGALGIYGGIHYLDRVSGNLERAERLLGMDFGLLTAPLVQNAPPAGVDDGCSPPKG